MQFAQQLAYYNVAVGCQAEQIIRWNCYPCLFVPKLTDVTVLKGKSGDTAGFIGYSEVYQATSIYLFIKCLYLEEQEVLLIY